MKKGVPPRKLKPTINEKAKAAAVFEAKIPRDLLLRTVEDPSEIEKNVAHNRREFGLGHLVLAKPEV